jgi:hypothetical protein
MWRSVTSPKDEYLTLTFSHAFIWSLFKVGLNWHVKNRMPTFLIVNSMTLSVSQAIQRTSQDDPEWRTDIHFKGSGHGLIETLFWHLSEGNTENDNHHYHDDRRIRQDSNQAYAVTARSACRYWYSFHWLYPHWHSDADLMSRTNETFSLHKRWICYGNCR